MLQSNKKGCVDFDNKNIAPSNTWWQMQEAGLNGLENLGNSCYFNSVIQCLSHTPKLTRTLALIKPPLDSLPGLYLKLIVRLLAKNTQQSRVRPITLLKEILNDRANNFERGIQGDAHELLSYAINAFHEASAKKVKITVVGASENCSEYMQKQKAGILAFKQEFENQYSTILNVFYGQMCNVIQSCDENVFRIKNVFETFSTLLVPVPSNTKDMVTLKDCLDLFFANERLDGANKFYDDVQHTYVDAIKSHHLWKLPAILLITLRRHQQDNSERLSKNQTAVAVPQYLDVAQYIGAENSHAGHSNYSLYAVCNHVGNANSGHYYAICRRAEGWFAFNDDEVLKVESPTSNENCPRVSRDNYILFYQRTDR